MLCNPPEKPNMEPQTWKIMEDVVPKVKMGDFQVSCGILGVYGLIPL